MKVKSLSRVQLLATPKTVAHQAPPSMGFSRQEYWSEVPLPIRSYIHENTGNKEADNHSDVGNTCLEGVLPPFLTQVLQRVQNDSIGDE